MKQVLAVLVLLAMAVRALIPDGYMLAPARAPSATFVLTICTGHGPLDAVFDPQSGEIHHRDSTPKDDPASPDPSKDKPCTFAAMAHLAPLQATIGLALPEWIETHATRIAIGIIPGRGLAAPPPWSTGPPLLS